MDTIHKWWILGYRPCLRKICCLCLRLEWYEDSIEALFPCVIHGGMSWSLPHGLPPERSESKWLKHSIQFQLCFYLMCSRLCWSWKGVCNLESKFLSKKRCFGWQTGCLSSTPVWGPHRARSGTRATLYVHTFYWSFAKQERLAEKKTIAVTPKWNWHVMQSKAHNKPLQFCQKLETDFR